MAFDVDAARAFAAHYFTESHEWWLHAQATAMRADEIAPVVGPLDRELLVCAAWLHDVGQCSAAVRTGFAPLDGARLLVGAGWPERVVALVAHHDESRITAVALGLQASLAAYRRQDEALHDALIYADLAAGSDGRRTSLKQRLDEIEGRHADDVPALRDAWQRQRVALLQAAARTEQRMVGLRRCRTVARAAG